jgi:hypothetical protein
MYARPRVGNLENGQAFEFTAACPVWREVGRRLTALCGPPKEEYCTLSRLLDLF